mmetsp:Transcript_4925/g.14019  ORF Transcript_4925/g.14019 Transcript_4925/m.14019 type:complete len:228 (+) Transcript_4925:241-924(+)
MASTGLATIVSGVAAPSLATEPAQAGATSTTSTACDASRVAAACAASAPPSTTWHACSSAMKRSRTAGEGATRPTRTKAMNTGVEPAKLSGSGTSNQNPAPGSWPGRQSPHSVTCIGTAGSPPSGWAAAAISARQSKPETSSPNTTCLPSRCGAGASVRNHCEVLLFLPELPMDRTPMRSCLRCRPRFSSLNLRPVKTLSPPVPLPKMKSPVWAMKPGTTRWNLHPR